MNSQDCQSTLTLHFPINSQDCQSTLTLHFPINCQDCQSTLTLHFPINSQHCQSTLTSTLSHQQSALSKYPDIYTFPWTVRTVKVPWHYTFPSTARTVKVLRLTLYLSINSHDCQNIYHLQQLLINTMTIKVSSYLEHFHQQQVSMNSLL